MCAYRCPEGGSTPIQFKKRRRWLLVVPFGGSFEPGPGAPCEEKSGRFLEQRGGPGAGCPFEDAAEKAKPYEPRCARRGQAPAHTGKSKFGGRNRRIFIC